MKHIGIVDVTTIGACICANEIVAHAARLGYGDKHPEFTMHSFPFGEYKALILDQNWEAVTAKILESIIKLHSVGADFIVMPANTPHYAYPAIAEQSPIPVINLIDLTVEECHRQGYQKVLVLGTIQTMNDGLYQGYFNKYQIEALIPDDETKEKIQSLILDEIIPSRINEKSVADLANKISKIDCDAAILGCTELPMVFDSENIGMATVDTTRLLAQYAVGEALNS